MTIHRLLTLAGLAATAMTATAAAQQTITFAPLSVTLPDDSRVFPAGPGAEVTNNNCLACHSVGMVLNQPTLSKAAWQAEVNKMIAVYKAPIAAADVPAIVDYLTAIKGPNPG